MTTFALRSLLSRKVRTALTAVAIVLGVAMMSGTYVLTDSISNAFDAIFTQSYRGTDAVISGKSAFDLSNSGSTTAPPFDESLLPEVKALPEVRAAIGGVGGEAQLIGKNGKAIVFGGAPNLGFSVDPTQPGFNSLTLVEGRWPKAGEVGSTSRRPAKDIKIDSDRQAQGPIGSCLRPVAAGSPRSAARRSPASISRPPSASSTRSASWTRYVSVQRPASRQRSSPRRSARSCRPARR